MCHKSFHFIRGICWLHSSKAFEAMKAGKLAIWPWLSCQYNKNMLVDFLCSLLRGHLLFKGFPKNLKIIRSL